ncbi:AfsR/SARP family transcriptional regulator [Wenjunlia tyrosinilytica]|uniref:Bacterial transcriptional activator domain-containing protein n=1 Tax=Wenjunlia tyrosinilytica TaxID=1544741 RepID=A0A917ZZ36_9ACTN|nr:AfsR/SARP family transcriptional regulator [Wenjunlia tyrosinilytica]GGP00922.1 hypothetical protein GCM10012280_70720 [Wenjunlia tyrosinilytica]
MYVVDRNSMSYRVHIGILGPLTVVGPGGQAIALRGQRQQIVLVLLAMSSGQPVSTERLISAIWEGNPPRTVMGQLQTSVWMLRQALLPVCQTQDTVLTHDFGYRLAEGVYTLDAVDFRKNVSSARQSQRGGDLPEALRQLRRGLAMWRGPSLTGINSSLVQAAARRLDDERVAALEYRMTVELALGHHDDVVDELRELVSQHPTRERLHADLMLALYRCGRQVEALAAFRKACRVLAEEYGLDPGPRLRDMAQAILQQDPGILIGP